MCGVRLSIFVAVLPARRPVACVTLLQRRTLLLDYMWVILNHRTCTLLLVLTVSHCPAGCRHLDRLDRHCLRRPPLPLVNMLACFKPPKKANCNSCVSTPARVLWWLRPVTCTWLLELWSYGLLWVVTVLLRSSLLASLFFSAQLIRNLAVRILRRIW